MKPQRLVALAAIVFMAACTGDTELPTAAPQEAPNAEAAAIPNHPFFNLGFSTTNALLLSATENTIPDPAVISITNFAGAFPTVGLPSIVKVEYIAGGATGWLTGGMRIINAFRADLMLRGAKGLPTGAYQAKVTLAMLGQVTYDVYVTYVSGVYWSDKAVSGMGWTYSGLWHHSLGNNCMNFRGCTPAAPAHTYNSEATGDFDVPPGVANSGDAWSPAFTVPVTAAFPVVDLGTWYEIEYDVAPTSFDYMTVVLRDEATTAETALGTINLSPGFVGMGTTLMGGSPFTNFVVPMPGGVAGGTYRVILRFATGDGSYNDYRGWGVVYLAVREGLAPPPTSAMMERRSGIDPGLIMFEGAGVRVGDVSTERRTAKR